MNNALLNEADVFSPQGLPAREQVTEWFKIKETIGNKIMGTFMGWWVKPSDNTSYQDQVGVALKKADGTVVGVSLSDTPYVRGRLELSQIGDRVGVKYEGDKDTGKPQPAKIVKIYNPDLEARKESGTVRTTAPEILKDNETSPSNGDDNDF